MFEIQQKGIYNVFTNNKQMDGTFKQSNDFVVEYEKYSFDTLMVLLNIDPKIKLNIFEFIFKVNSINICP